MLYRLSYALPWPLDGFEEIAIVFGHLEKHVLPLRFDRVAGNAGEAVFPIMLSARAV
ncbi:MULTISPECIES: hypothetical protein [Bradyrhizobium]|uniref:hypothetical protein n=1 Tax=Bradyrhizobium TaxID=374 RepID=UPI00165331FE|nr:MULTISPECIES: hypothetical protein [Bradyrhizobium]MCK1711293.1 hypothetical protein [Bradyrhizobium sp. 143]MCK1727714.1 hypothetical protein [Bradyrhizobium sp. 142]